MKQQQVYIVTGSASGVGAAAAVALARLGAAVAVNYSKSAAEAERVVGECKAAGGDAISVQCDVARDDDCRRLAAKTLGKWGRIDGLVNNAGTTKFASMRNLDALSAEDFSAHLQRQRNRRLPDGARLRAGPAPVARCNRQRVVDRVYHGPGFVDGLRRLQGCA